MTLIVNGDPIPAELLSKVRSTVPEEERYNLKFVVYPIAQGICGQMDAAQLVEGLDQVAVVRNFGLSPKALQKTLQADWNGKGRVVRVIRDQPARKSARKAKLRVTQPKKIPSQQVKVRVENPRKELFPPVEIGTLVTVTDPRRTMTGRILDSDQKLTKVMWDSGRKSVIDTKRLYTKRFYKIG